MNSRQLGDAAPRWQLLSDGGPPPLSDVPAEDRGTQPDMRGQCLMFCPRCGMPATHATDVCTRCGARRCVGCGD